MTSSSLSLSRTLRSLANLRIESGCWVFHLLDEPRHVFQEEIVKMLLLHVLKLEDGFASLGRHCEDGVSVGEVEEVEAVSCHRG